MNEKKVLIYGDSIMKGIVYDENSRRYVPTLDPLMERFSGEHRLQIVNHSVFGATIGKGERALNRDLQAGTAGQYALVEFGGNDCTFKWKEVSQDPGGEHLPNTPLNTFVEKYLQMIDSLKQRGIQPILMTLPPIDAERFLDFLAQSGLNRDNILRWLGDAQMIYRYHERYSNAIRKIAADTGALLVDVRSYFLDQFHYSTLICGDGLHVSPQGQNLIYEAFTDFAAGLGKAQLA